MMPIFFSKKLQVLLKHFIFMLQFENKYLYTIIFIGVQHFFKEKVYR